MHFIGGTCPIYTESGEQLDPTTDQNMQREYNRMLDATDVLRRIAGYEKNTTLENLKEGDEEKLNKKIEVKKMSLGKGGSKFV